MVTAPHTPVPFSPTLEDLYIPSAAQIADAARKTMRGKALMAAITQIVMPKWGLSMKEGTFNEWLVEEGTEITVGMPILDVETDKIANAVEAPDAELLRRRVASAGDSCR